MMRTRSPRNALVQRLSATDGPFTRIASCNSLVTICRKGRISIGCSTPGSVSWGSPSWGLLAFCGRPLFQDSLQPATYNAAHPHAKLFTRSWTKSPVEP